MLCEVLEDKQWEAAAAAAAAPGRRTHSLRRGHVSGGNVVAAEVAGVVTVAGRTAVLPLGLIEGMSLCGKWQVLGGFLSCLPARQLRSYILIVLAGCFAV